MDEFLGRSVEEYWFPFYLLMTSDLDDPPEQPKYIKHKFWDFERNKWVNIRILKGSLLCSAHARFWQKKVTPALCAICNGDYINA